MKCCSVFVYVISIVSVCSWFCIYFVCHILFCILRLGVTLDVYALHITLLHYIYNGKHSAILCRMTGIFYVLLYLARGWDGYRNKSQHKKWTLEKKIISPHFLGLEPGTFRSRGRRSTPELSPLPLYQF